MTAMAASKNYRARPNYRFLPNDRSLTNDSMIFELDESDVWSTEAPSQSQSPEIRKVSSSSGNGRVCGPSSMPVNVPDWSKILKDEYRENRPAYSDDEDSESGDRIPPHEFLARTRIASFSVHEGIGRTLKGRDLSRVRDAIWHKIGFED